MDCAGESMVLSLGTEEALHKLGCQTGTRCVWPVSGSVLFIWNVKGSVYIFIARGFDLIWCLLLKDQSGSHVDASEGRRLQTGKEAMAIIQSLLILGLDHSARFERAKPGSSKWTGHGDWPSTWPRRCCMLTRWFDSHVYPVRRIWIDWRRDALFNETEPVSTKHWFAVTQPAAWPSCGCKMS